MRFGESRSFLGIVHGSESARRKETAPRTFTRERAQDAAGGALVGAALGVAGAMLASGLAQNAKEAHEATDDAQASDPANAHDDTHDVLARGEGQMTPMASGARSDPEKIFPAGRRNKQQKTIRAKRAETVLKRPEDTVHDVTTEHSERERALLTIEGPLLSGQSGLSKLPRFPALVTLLVSDSARDVLLASVLAIDQCAEYLDVPQVTWLLGALFEEVRKGTASSGAAYARVVGRKKKLQNAAPGLESMDPHLASAARSPRGVLDTPLVETLRDSLKSTEAVREYVSALSASGVSVSFKRTYAIASVLEGLMSTPKSHDSTVLSLDRALAALASRCVDVPARDDSTLKELVRAGCSWLPETMAALVRKLVNDDKGYLSPADDASTIARHYELVTANEVTANDLDSIVIVRFMVAACADVDKRSLFHQNAHPHFRVQFEATAKSDDKAYVAESHLLLAEVDPSRYTYADLVGVLSSVAMDDLLPLWQRHPSVRAAIGNDNSLLETFLDHHADDFDKVICVSEDGSANGEWRSGAQVWLSKALESKVDGVSIALERAPVDAAKHFANKLQTMVLSRDASVPMARLAAVLGRLEVQAPRERSMPSGLLDALKESWEMAPSAVLDAARYWNVAGSDLFDLLVAGAKWGRYEHIRTMSNRLGPWTPDPSAWDSHARMVGAFFGLCPVADAAGGGNDVTQSTWVKRWYCSESGSHDDAIVALSAWKHREYLLTHYAADLRSRGFSGVHGILTVPGNGAPGTETSPSQMRAKQAELAMTTDVETLSRAIRATPYLVTLVGSDEPKLSELLSRVPECASSLDKAQREALGDRGRSSRVEPSGPEPQGVLGEADVSRMLSAAYIRHLRGEDVVGHVESVTQKLKDNVADHADKLVLEYNGLIEDTNRKWTVRFVAADTPRGSFGRRRRFI